MTRIYKPDPEETYEIAYTAEAINEALADHQQEMYFRCRPTQKNIVEGQKKTI